MEENPQELNAREDDQCAKNSTPVKSNDEAVAASGKGGKGSSSCNSAGATAAVGTSGGAGGYLFNLIDRFNSLKKVKQKVEEEESGNMKEPNECNGTEQDGDMKKGADEASRDGDAQKGVEADVVAKSESGSGKKGVEEESEEGMEEEDGSEETGETGETVETAEGVEESCDQGNPQDEMDEGASEPASCDSGKKANSKGAREDKEKPTNVADAVKEGDGDASNENGSNRAKSGPSDRGVSEDDFPERESGNCNEDPLMKSLCDRELAKVQELIKQIKKTKSCTMTS